MVTSVSGHLCGKAARYADPGGVRARLSALGRGAFLVSLLPLVACGGDSTGPSHDFLIRSPWDNPASAAVATFRMSPSSPDSIVFEWDPSRRATRYQIAFWRVPSRDSMMLYRVGPAEVPSFGLSVDSPTFARVPVNRDHPSGPTVPVVPHVARLSELDGVVERAGLEGSGPFYFVWSVIAEGGGRRVRSIERHRMVLHR
jgi:hypothetical protein